ncbi:MAG: hypothetical protein FWC79_04875 [Oscillospiraceae bacterium]|nr:hypothetical protein [Oscillospiraceae bacterium]
MGKKNYRKGGFFVIPATTIALVIAYFMEAPLGALWSIGICGYGVSILLFLLGNKSHK